jgi:hypothetical protein
VSVAYFIVLDKEKPGFDPSVNGKSLAQDAKRIARIAKELGIPELDEYVSYSPEEARGMIEDLGGDPNDVEFPEVKWFSAEDGLAWVAKLTEHVKSHRAAVKNAKGVLSDLEEYAEVLEKAKKAGARWRLQVDI